MFFFSSICTFSWAHSSSLTFYYLLYLFLIVVFFFSLVRLCARRFDCVIYFVVFVVVVMVGGSKHSSRSFLYLLTSLLASLLLLFQLIQCFFLLQICNYCVFHFGLIIMLLIYLLFSSDIFPLDYIMCGLWSDLNAIVTDIMYLC